MSRTEAHYALDVRDLAVSAAGGAPIVVDVCFRLRRGEILGVVGESGSGKTTVALALMGYARVGVRIDGGSVRVEGREMLALSGRALRRLRGGLVSYVPQDPATCLNPAMRVESILVEIAKVHGITDSQLAVANVLSAVNLPTDRGFRRRFPHQLSGGQQQRVAIACALIASPAVIVLDEPTTGLDVITQAHIIAEIKRLRSEIGVAVVFVSHDLALVASLADKIAVMYAGRIVEEGPTHPLIRRPRHPYTLGLVSSIPDPTTPRRLAGIPGVVFGVEERPPGCAFAPRCSQRVPECDATNPPFEDVDEIRVRCIEWIRTPESETLPRAFDSAKTALQPVLVADRLRAEYRTKSAPLVVAEDVSFVVGGGECLALVGESGSGKTTIARCVVGLHSPADGSVRFLDELLAARARTRSREQRRMLQIVFQNPYDSLNPHNSVIDSIAWPARRLLGMSRRGAESAAKLMLERVRLPHALGTRYPPELSGGECQRVAIARALVVKPRALICDEVTSALDVSVQATVLDLLAELRAEFDLAMLFITHDLGIVASIADRVLVLRHGAICEQGEVQTILSSPRDPYTRSLLEAAPSLSRALEGAA